MTMLPSGQVPSEIQTCPFMLMMSPGFMAVSAEPEDTDGFVRKWRVMQEKITETLPLLPVYSNLYFDFYTRELHQYDVTQGASWAEAVVRSCMSDMEELPAGERQRIRRELEEQFGK